MALTDVQVRNLHYGTAAAAVVLLLVGALALGGSGDATARVGVIVLLVVLVAVQAWLFLQDRKAMPAEAGWEPPAEEPAGAAAGPAQAGAADEAAPRMVIRCKQCGEVFPVVDTGARPLVASCPHCGREGTIKTKPPS